MRTLIINQSVTNRTATLEKYLNDISAIDLLNMEEEIMLGEKMRKGDRAAFDRFVKANLRFVVSVAKKYQHNGMDLEDLVAEGNFGLIKAAERFDATKGFKFISFAVWWIRQSIMHALAEKRRAVRLPGNQIIGISRIKSAEVELEQQMERIPTHEELAEHLDLPIDKVKDYIDSAPMALSLDKESVYEEGGCLLDVVPDPGCKPLDDELMEESKRLEVNRILERLTSREQQVLKLFFGLCGHTPMELADIAEELQLSKERVRQIKTALISSLREKYSTCDRFRYLMQ